MDLKKLRIEGVRIRDDGISRCRPFCRPRHFGLVATFAFDFYLSDSTMSNAGEDSDFRTDREQRYDEFVGLLARQDASLRRFVRSLLASPDGVDDVLQETALECWRKFSGFHPEGKADVAEEFTRWACVIARFKVLSLQRDRSRDRLVFRDSVVERLADSAATRMTNLDHERRAVETCLRKLNRDQRRLVMSVHSPGQSVSKIARETGENARRLYSQVNAIRRLLLDCVRGQLSGEPEYER